MHMTMVMACLLILGLASTAHAYRTAADLPEYPDSARIALNASEISLNVYERVPDGLNVADVLHELDLAVAEWNAVACPNGGHVELRVTGTTPGAAATDGSVTVQFVMNDWESLGFDANAVASTDVTIVTEGERIYIAEADIFVRGDASVRWTIDAEPGAVDLRSMLTHELGHLIGLHHTDVAGATMVAYDQSRDGGSAEARSLEEDDRLGYCFLNDPACPTDGCGPNRECIGGACVASCASAPCAPGVECVEDLCTPESCPPQTCGPTCEVACPDRRGDLGDACTTEGECRSGRCGDLGVCTSRCETSRDCPSPFECTSGECVATISVFGEMCRMPSECTGDVCVLEVGRTEGFCSRDCASATSSCPLGYRCSEVEMKDICIPEAEQPSGCDIGGEATGGLWIAVLAIAATMVRRTRRRASTELRR
jgi:hypothetical protein